MCARTTSLRVCLLGFALLSVARGADLILGYRTAASSVVYSAVHEAGPALWVRREEVRVNCSNYEIFNAIEIIDLRMDKAGEASITSGGLGEHHVYVTLRSPSLFRGYEFLVELYAIHTEYNFHGPPQHYT